ncbi:hypothetical protein NVP1293O_07 [Vibrio phage 1.293.O._10N.261.52.E1]|nr:hypothetical protein NVP1293O_07 [Vibrio phage 1.293.O._10N.261.52.E1]
MAQRKIPAFLSKEFNSLSKSEKDELLFKLDAWKESSITRSLLEHIDKLVVMDEDAEDTATFETEFQTMQDYAWHKGKRNALRNILKQLERDE